MTRVVTVVIGLTGLVAGMIACGGDATAPAPTTGVNTYWGLQFNQHAVMLALTSPYDTLRLSATPRDANGVALPDLGALTYRGTDSSVTVSPTGLITAHYVTPVNAPALVIASLQTQGVTNVDTVFVSVTASPEPLSMFSMQPAPGDSAKRSLDYERSFATPIWSVRTTNATGTTICDASECDINVYYQSSNPLIAAIDPHTGSLKFNDTGYVTLTASSLVYGVPRRDSVRFRVGASLSIYFLVGYGGSDSSGNPNHPEGIIGSDDPRKIILGVGAVIEFISFRFPVPRSVPFIFDRQTGIEPAADMYGDPPMDGGNVLLSGENWATARRFTQAGTYYMHVPTVMDSSTFEIDIIPQ